jgi:hypothetical protein
MNWLLGGSDKQFVCKDQEKTRNAKSRQLDQEEALGTPKQERYSHLITYTT